jgi:hypothetical protein
MIRSLAVAALLLGLSHPSDAQTLEEWQRLLRERDVEIEALRHRVRALERDLAPEGEDDEPDRALERTLVQQGAMVLRPGSFEVEPHLSYAHWDRRRSALRHVSEATISFRGGIGWDSQFQVRIPYVHVSTSVGSADGLGDVDFSLSKQLRRETVAWPGLVAALGWIGRTGEDGFETQIPTGSGFHIPYASLTAVKRRDPLVFYGGMSFASPRNRTVSGVTVAPGDSVGLRLGSLLAASPNSSVIIGLNVTSVGATRLNGQRVPESDAVLGTLQIGFGTILSRRSILNVTGEFGLTAGVPDFRVNVALPIRFY